MAQRPSLPRKPALLKRYSESSLLRPSTLPRYVDHEEIAKLLGDIPARQRLFNTSSADGSIEAPNRYNRRFSELDYESHRSAPHGHTSSRHSGQTPSAPQIPIRRLPRRSMTYSGVPKTHLKRFVRIQEARNKDGTTANNKDSTDNKETTVHIPGEDDAVSYPSKDKQTPEKKKEEKTDKTDTDGTDVRQDKSRGSTAIKSSGNGSIRRYRRSHRRKPKTIGDQLPFHCEKPEDEANTRHKRKLSQLSQMSSFSLSIMDDDEDTQNLDQCAINNMLSHRYDDLAGMRRGSRTLHISRSPLTPTRSVSASIRRSHKPHQENLESNQQEVDIPGSLNGFNQQRADKSMEANGGDDQVVEYSQEVKAEVYQDANLIYMDDKIDKQIPSEILTEKNKIDFIGGIQCNGSNGDPSKICRLDDTVVYKVRREYDGRQGASVGDSQEGKTKRSENSGGNDESDDMDTSPKLAHLKDSDGCGNSSKQNEGSSACAMEDGIIMPRNAIKQADDDEIGDDATEKDILLSKEKEMTMSYKAQIEEKEDGAVRRKEIERRGDGKGGGRGEGGGKGDHVNDSGDQRKRRVTFGAMVRNDKSDKRKRRLTYGDLVGNDKDKPNPSYHDKPDENKVIFGALVGNGTEEPNRSSPGSSRKVTFQDVPEGTTPRRRRAGVIIDHGVDHAKLRDMLVEMGDFGEKRNHNHPDHDHPDDHTPGDEDSMEISDLDAKPDQTDGMDIKENMLESDNLLGSAQEEGSSNDRGLKASSAEGRPFTRQLKRHHILGGSLRLPSRPKALKDPSRRWKSLKRDPRRDQLPIMPRKNYAHFGGQIQKHSQLFVQLNELDRDDISGQQSIILSKSASWKSRARWIKFEENWEQGADRWSKPHVASLTFNSLPQLRRGLENGLIMLDVLETSLPNIFNLLVDGLVRMELIEPEHQGSILRMLHLCGTGNKKSNKSPLSGVSAVRRLSQITDLGRHNSTDNNVPPSSPGNKSLQTFIVDTNCSNNTIYSTDEVHVAMLDNHDGVSHNNNNSQHQHGIPREGIMRKLPEDAEGAMVMVAMEDSLNGPVAALIRLVDPPVFDNFLEASIPLRFIFFLVGPDYSNVDYHEVGRAMSTLFSDDIFRDMAYAALDKQDLLNGINEFLNDTMVLPPGDWDRDLLLPITRQAKREQEKVMQRRKTISPLQMEKDAEAILKMSQDALNYADPLQRTGRIFGGLVNDVKRRFPHYKSDFTEALNFQCVAAFMFVYFACLSPAITFGGLLGEKTDNWMGVSEMIVSTSLCGMLFALLSGQPLVILGGTGPVLIFEEYLYKFCKQIEIDFMAFRTWIGFWICILATIVVAFEGSVLVRYFTRFTEEIFSVLISVIFIFEVYKGLRHIVCTNPLLPNYCFDEVHVTVIESILNGSQLTSSTTDSGLFADYPSSKTDTTHSGSDSMQDPYNCNVTIEDDLYAQTGGDYGCSPGSKTPQPNTALFAIILTFGTFFISFFLRIFRSSRFLGRTARRALGNFGIAIAIFAMVTMAYLVGDIYTHTIKITDGFHPTDPCKRGWLINPMGQTKRLPPQWLFGAIVPAFLVFILLYMETLLIGMVVNKECNKLRKGSGYHLDLFLIGVLSALAGILGVPWMCAAPIRTVSHIGSLSVLTRTHAPGVKPKLDHIKDQRITNFAVSFLIGLSNLLAPVLREVPIAVLLGVFLYLGVTSLSGLQFIDRLKIFFMPRKHHPDVRYIRMVKVWKMHLFTIVQVVCVLVLWVIKNSIIAMAFPFFLILLIFIRRLLKYFFSESELEALDSEEEDEDDDRQVYDYDLG